MFDNNIFDRIVQAKTKNDAIKVLEEMEYGNLKDDLPEDLDFEDILSKEQEKLYNLLSKLDSNNVVDIFRHSFDYYNTKVLLKSEFLKDDKDDKDDYRLLSTGTIQCDDLKAMIIERKLGELPVILHEAILNCLESLNRVRDPQIIDIIIDRENYRQMKISACETNNSFVIEYVETLIDLNNIKTWIRLRVLKKSWNFIQKVLLDGGSLDKKIFIDNVDNDVESAIEKFQFTKYFKVVEEILNDFYNKSFDGLEKAVDNYLIDLAKKAKYISFGIEPLVAYMIAKECEIKNLRIAIIGKINNIPKDIIQERLRDVYV